MPRLIDKVVLSNQDRGEVRAEGDGYRLIYSLDFRNRRLRVLDYKLDPGKGRSLQKFLEGEAGEKKLGKVIIYSRLADENEFEEAGLSFEGSIPGYFRGQEARCFSIFTDLERKSSRELSCEEKIIERLLLTGEGKVCVTSKYGSDQAAAKTQFLEASGYEFRSAGPDDAKELSCLYDSVFASYPTPTDDPGYIGKSMSGGVSFYVACHRGRVVSAASADLNWPCLNAEMTDCATLPEHRGKGLIEVLLHSLELAMNRRGLVSLYTLARATSPGMNRAFWRLGYRYSGRLINNCHIAGQFEDMNIWGKLLSP